MAKSARSSRIKENRSKLRKTVHAPVEDARLARLSEKLLETARAAKESEAADADAMDVETEKPAEEKTEGEAAKPLVVKKRLSKGRVQRRTKARNTMVFKSLQKGVRVSTKKGAGKK